MIVVTGQLSDMPDLGTKVTYLAASPVDRGGSFSGSGFPFTCESMAFESTPNKGVLNVKVDGFYSVEIRLPNSFYQRLGSDLIPPTIFIRYQCLGKEVIVARQIDESIPFRTLTYPKARHNVTFYDKGHTRDFMNSSQDDVKTQEQILRDSGYPCCSMTQPLDFWGLVTPQ